MKKTIITAIATLFISFTFAQEKILFKLAPEFNKTMKYEFIQNQDFIQQKDSANFKTVYTSSKFIFEIILSQIEDSLINVHAHLKKMNCLIDEDNKKIELDSEVEPDIENKGKWDSIFNNRVGTKFSFKMNGQGVLQRDSLDMYSSGRFSEIFCPNLPRYPISIGETWEIEDNTFGKNITKNSISLAEMEYKGYKINFLNEIEGPNNEKLTLSSGYKLIDPRTFLISYLKIDSELDIKIMKIKTEIELKRID